MKLFDVSDDSDRRADPGIYF